MYLSSGSKDRIVRVIEERRKEDYERDDVPFVLPKRTKIGGNLY